MASGEQRRDGYHHGNLREALIQAALVLMAERGLTGFAIAELARAVGVSPAAPYRHFRDRNAVVAEVARRGFEQLAAELEAAQAAAARLTSPWFRHYLAFDPQPSLTTVRGAVLLLHGTADDMADAQTNLDLLAKGLKANKRVQVQKLEGINHLLQAPTTEWPLLNGQLRPIMATSDLEEVREWIKAVAAE